MQHSLVLLFHTPHTNINIYNEGHTHKPTIAAVNVVDQTNTSIIQQNRQTSISTNFLKSNGPKILNRPVGSSHETATLTHMALTYMSLNARRPTLLV